MKILIISPSPPSYLGGLANFTKNLAERLAGKGIDVNLLTTTLNKKGTYIEKILKNYQIIKKKCYLFPNHNNFLKIKNPLFNVLSYLFKYSADYDLIHVHSYIYFSTIQLFIFRLLFRKKTPIVLHLHGGIQTRNYSAQNIMERFFLFIKNYIFDLTFGKIMLNKADAVISVSKEDLQTINQVFKINRKKENYFIPNCINTNEFRKINTITKDYIGFVGNLTKIKGIDILLKIIKNIQQINNNLKFLIIGDGPYESIIKSLSNIYPILHYKNIPHKNMPIFYNKCSVIIQTSRTEGLPTCILEALACEVPVVASDVGGTSEIVKNGYNGYLYNLGDVENAIEKILTILGNNNIKMGENGRKTVITKFSWNTHINKIIKVYNKVLNE